MVWWHWYSVTAQVMILIDINQNPISSIDYVVLREYGAMLL